MSHRLSRRWPGSRRMATSRELASTLHGAIATGQVAELEPLMTADAIVWHNSDRVLLPKEQALARIAGAAQVADNLQVDLLALHDTAAGFVDQLVLRGSVRATGSSLELHNCLVVTVRD